MTKTPPSYYLFKDTTSPINAFAQANSLWAFHRNLGSELEKRPHRRVLHMLLCLPCSRKQSMSLPDRWLPQAPPRPEPPPTNSGEAYFSSQRMEKHTFHPLSLPQHYPWHTEARWTSNATPTLFLVLGTNRTR